jgi:hypothetical protein
LKRVARWQGLAFVAPFLKSMQRIRATHFRHACGCFSAMVALGTPVYYRTGHFLTPSSPNSLFPLSLGIKRSGVAHSSAQEGLVATLTASGNTCRAGRVATTCITSTCLMLSII